MTENDNLTENSKMTQNDKMTENDEITENEWQNYWKRHKSSHYSRLLTLNDLQ